MALSSLGCAKLYQESGANFAKGQTGSGNAVLGAIGPIAHVERVRLVESSWLDQVPEDLPFEKFACAGSGAYVNERAAVNGLKTYAEHIAAMTKEPDKNVGALWKSITTKRPEMLEPPAAAGDREALCRALVTELLGAPSKGLEVESGALLALEALPKLIAALDKMAVSALTMVDEAKRGAALKQYVTASKETVNALLGALTLTDDNLVEYCVGDRLEGPICKPFLERAPTTIDGAFVRRRWAALRLPYYRFTALSTLQAGVLPEARTVEQKRDILAEATAAHLELADFDALWHAESPAKLVQVMSLAQADLERLASGELSKAEYWQLAKAFAQTVKDIREGYAETRTQIDALGQ
jgi:hypothetical protein